MRDVNDVSEDFYASNDFVGEAPPAPPRSAGPAIRVPPVQISKLPLLSCVTVPGSIHGAGGVARVIRACGGEERLSQSLGQVLQSETAGPRFLRGFWQRNDSDGPSVFLRLNPDDRYSKFLAGSAVPCSSLCVRLRRRGGVVTCCEAVGFVAERVSFNTLADFICVPPPEVSRSPKLDLDAELGGSGVLYTPPPAFSRIAQPFAYGYQSNPLANAPGGAPVARLAAGKKRAKRGGGRRPGEAVGGGGSGGGAAGAGGGAAGGGVADAPEGGVVAAAAGEAGAGEAGAVAAGAAGAADAAAASAGAAGAAAGFAGAGFSAGGGRNFTNAVARFNDLCLPLPPAVPPTGVTDAVLLSAVRALFAQQPVWLRPALLEALPAAAAKTATPWRLKPVLSQTCFTFSDGPWRGALCVFGYDPRKTPEARFFQTIDFRDPYFRSVAWRSRATAADGASGGAAGGGAGGSGGAGGGSGAAGGGGSGVAPASGGGSASGADPGSGGSRRAERLFLRPPSRYSQLFQLCSIADFEVRRLVREAPVARAGCTREAGWFEPSFLESVRVMMFMRSKEMRAAEGEAAAKGAA